jgi:predicted short-subunit dehydrogenase-like oxidoreductase (DUF2520 family)
MIIKPSITIFGLGRVGGVLRKSFTEADYQIRSVFKRDSFPESTDDLGDLIFLCIQDGEIETLTNKLSDSFSSFSDKVIIHCSGTLGSAILKPFKNKGAKTASFHPLKAIAQNDDSLEKVWFDIEGDTEALTELEKIAKDFKANSFEVKPEAKPLLHAAAVVSSNYLVTLMKLATDIAEVGGIGKEVALQALLPLTESSICNVKEKGFENALTGPVARGDIKTVDEHLKQLKDKPDLLNLYKALGYKTISLAKNLNQNQVRELKQLLK